MTSATRTDAPRRTTRTIAEERQRRNDDVMRQIQKERQTFEEKVARLRELRLAKQAADAISATPESKVARLRELRLAKQATDAISAKPVSTPRKSRARRTQG